MGEINYEVLVTELIKPLVTHPADIKVIAVNESASLYKIKALVHPDDLGRVIGKKGRVASAIRTIAHAAAIRQSESIEIDFASIDE